MRDAAFVRDPRRCPYGLRNRGSTRRDLEQLATFEGRRRRLIPEMEGLKREQTTSRRSGPRQAAGPGRVAVFAANKARAGQIKQLEVQVDAVDQQRTASSWTRRTCRTRAFPSGECSRQRRNSPAR